MKKIFSLALLVSFSTLVFSSLSFATPKPKSKHSATCTGSKNCNACKNCKYCKHCAKNGRKCGVCK